ncbi:hypothetical protein BX659_12626 [Orenia metallireducens]|uniref:PD-(D/E)XK nuclease-like domain-containing protein n=1 Tax=Orenia metallireducens TaxID=1413210 RepID=A0A285I2B5_9FIRM|nr:hypothetical protein [Orenia metallireducens]PRX23247.1 hypothetical protein BX659_12626 [Orenia metallireducens]SNY42074.1 hypothetical protein SAMN06265827_12926 [Orenia metallireducens]
MKETFKTLVGTSRKTSKRMRVHQGWWRTFVLGEEEGESSKDNPACNVMKNGEGSKVNFLTKNIRQVVRETLESRDKYDSGIMNTKRLHNNLLSSQPATFNFFAEFKLDKVLAKSFLEYYIPEVTEVLDVKFEYVPKFAEIGDNSAFDVVFEFKIGDGLGLFGLEVKYIDDFSAKPSNSKLYYGQKGNKNYDNYFRIFSNSRSEFLKDYEDYVESKKFNQLFRNQLIAEKALSSGKYDYIVTGLFTPEGHKIKEAQEFQSILKRGSEKFKIITYWDMIEKLQKLDLSKEQRKWTMLLWTRYSAVELSEKIYKLY